MKTFTEFLTEIKKDKILSNTWLVVLMDDGIHSHHKSKSDAISKICADKTKKSGSIYTTKLSSDGRTYYIGTYRNLEKEGFELDVDDYIKNN
jgi:hypothetical protein